MTTEKKKKKKLSRAGKIILDVIMIAALGVAGFSGYKLYKETEKYRVAQASYKDLRKDVLVEAEGDKKVIDWDALHAVNEDIGLWITMPGSTIDYPVIYQNDNEFYLRHLPDGTWNEAGTVFVDMNNGRDICDANTVLYGHHMLDDPLMFAELENFKDADYAADHKEIHIYSPEHEWIMYPVGGFVTTGYDDYVKVKFATAEDYQAYIDSLMERNIVESDVSLTKDDKMMLLSTCSYDVYDGRWVLFGKIEQLPD